MDDEQALVEKIAASNALTDDLGKLLLFLYQNRDKQLFAKDIETLHYHYPETHHKHDSQHSRERIDQLKERLEKYALQNSNDELRCVLPDAKGKRGYRLRFEKGNKAAKATATFWGAHIESDKDTSVVCDPLLFFYGHPDGKLLRFVDTNIEGPSRKLALSELKRLHPESHHDDLIAGHFYVDVGSVLAAELLRDYFWSSANLRVPLFVDKERIQQPWTRSSPILLGTTRTNTLMRRIFGSSITKNLAYRLHTDRFSWVTIDRPTETEKKAINAIEQVKWEGDNSFTTTAPELTLGIVTRTLNPNGGSGVMTFISSDATRNTTQMAAALTDETQLRGIFAEMGHSYAKPLPDTFEMLFFVRQWPGDLDDAAAEAELLAWRCPESVHSR